MNSRYNGFERFYDDQVAAHRQFYSRENIYDRFTSSSVSISVAVLLFTFIFKIYSPDSTLEGIFYAIGNFLWDTLVFVTPATLLFAVDSWMNPSTSSSSMPESQLSTHVAKSEAMRRVMGLDRASGMMSSVFQARSRALSITGGVLGLKLDTDRPPGLGNRDNSCYQNSILQGLASLQSMPDYLAACIRDLDSAAHSADRDVAQTLRGLISNLNDVENNGKTIWTPSLLKSMSTWTQQDAQEYYSKVLDDIDKGAAKAAQALASSRITGLEGSDYHKDECTSSQHSDDSGYQSLSSNLKRSEANPLRNPLEGLLAQRVACVQCGYSDGLSMIPFNCLTLSLGLDKSQHDLYERLDSYSKVETIDGVNCPKCTLLKAQRLLGKLVERMQDGGSSKEQLAEPLRRLEAVETALEEDDFDDKTIEDACKISAQGRVSTTKTKQMVIARPPQSLAVHVNRSVFDPSTFHMIKNSAPVNFPLTLDLGPWCLGSAEAKSKPSDADTASSPDGDASEEQWQLDPMASMVAGDLEPSRLTGPIYELRAAVTHYGRHENGHYICYRKYPPSSLASNNSMDGDNNSIIDTGLDGVDEDVSGTGASEAKGFGGHLSGDRDMAWWRLSDHNVSRVDEDVVMSLGQGVFMLFYECVDPSMILQSEDDDREVEQAKAEADTPPRDLADDVEGQINPSTTNDVEGGCETVPATDSKLSSGEEQPATGSQ